MSANERADIETSFAEWQHDAATAPLDPGADNRIYMRGPDGHLIVVGEATGLVWGPLADDPDAAA